LSRTDPVIVASDLLELAASASPDRSDTSAIRDKLKPNALLMRKDLRDQSPVGKKAKLVQARRLYRNPKQAVIVCHAANLCQVRTP
jgi:hypothetical protein